MVDQAEKPSDLVKVKLLTSMAGDRCSWGVGDVREVPADEAARLIAAGSAERVGKAK